MESLTYSLAAIREIETILSAVDANAVLSLGEKILKANAVFVAGAGRSLLMLRAFAMRLMHLNIPVYVVGDVTTPAIQPDDLLIIGSGSGKTKTLQVVAEKAQSIGAARALLSIFADSPLAQKSDLVVVIPGATDKVAGEFVSKQPAGSSYEQTLLLVLDGLVMWLSDQLAFEQKTFARHANLE